MTPKPDTNFLSGTAASGPYRTRLSLDDELRFRQWVKTDKVPFDDSPQSDYDMRGYWKARESGDPEAGTKISAFDNAPHYPDKWKTPYHKTFSKESVYSTENAPQWQGDKLKDKLGTVLADETPRKSQKKKRGKRSTKRSD
jgi:hypothetical protein